MLDVMVVPSTSRFSAALCRGLIEADMRRGSRTGTSPSFPRLYAAASLKLNAHSRITVVSRTRFPRLYAAASLKLRDALTGLACSLSFPRLYAAASLKHFRAATRLRRTGRVFRGFMPRPH